MTEDKPSNLRRLCTMPWKWNIVLEKKVGVRLAPAARFIIGFSMALGLWYGVWMICSAGRNPVNRLELVVAPALVTVLVFHISARQDLNWRRPSKNLEALAREARAGLIPIDELSRIGGEIGPLALLVQDLLRDIRREKRRNAELQLQNRQHVAQRTDALQRVIGSLKTQASIDKLTGLHNRRMLEDSLHEFVGQALDAGRDCCLMMIDVDHFKLLNDTLGHDAGDTMLKDLGRIIRSSLRTGDFAFRLGGDEFLILFPGSEAAGARVMGDRLRQLVDGLVKPMKVRPSPRISFGIASALQPLGVGREDRRALASAMMKAADTQLYAMKADRRRTSAAAVSSPAGSRSVA